MKHLKLWCLVLIIFVGLSAILLIGKSEKSTRSIASIESSQALNNELDQLIKNGNQLSNEEVETQANIIMDKIENATSEAAAKVSNIYSRGQEILVELDSMESINNLNDLNSEIEELQKELNLYNNELEVLEALVGKAAKENSSLSAPIAGIKERLDSAKEKIKKANFLIADLEENKPGVLEQIKDKLLIAQTSELESLKKKNCDMEQTICRQEDELSKLQADVEKLLEDKQEVVESVAPQSSLGYMGLMMQMQLNMMTAMMNNFSLYFPVVSSTPFSGPNFFNSQSYAPRYEFDLVNNYFGYNPMTPMAPQIAQEQTNNKKKSLSVNKKASAPNATQLTDKEIQAINNAQFEEKTYTPSRWSVDTPESYALNR